MNRYEAVQQNLLKIDYESISDADKKFTEDIFQRIVKKLPISTKEFNKLHILANPYPDHNAQAKKPKNRSHTAGKNMYNEVDEYKVNHGRYPAIL